MENILVTGGCGFIGSHVVLGLLKKGYGVIVLDSNINSTERVIDKIKFLSSLDQLNFQRQFTFIRGDIRNQNLLEKIFNFNLVRGKRVTSVVHLAGLKSVKDSLINPIDYWDNNVLGSLTLFKVMIKYACFKLVFSSSATVYGNPIDIPIYENSKTEPINPYGQTKLTVENIMKDLFAKFSNDFKIIILRYFNPIGAHYSGLIGENYNLSSDNIFPNIVKVALRKDSYLKIFGNNWPTKDGTTIRDFIHVMDLADAHISAIDFLNSNKPNLTTLNLGTGQKTTILDLIRTFENENKIKIPIKYFEKRPGDTPVLLANGNLAKKILNWEVRNNLSDMCKDGWNFAKKNSNIF